LQCHQRVEEIARRTRVDAEPLLERFAIVRVLGELGEEPISTALKSVLEAQKPRATCMI